MTDARVEALRNDWDRAVERDRPADAVKALVELEKLEPNEPGWSQRLGEALRRLGKSADAVQAFVRATERYAKRGFFPRAIAMAKLAASLDPSQAALLARLEPPKPDPKAPPAPKKPPPLPLARAKDSRGDEVRFEDATEASSIDVVLEDVSDVIVLGDSDLVPVSAAGKRMPSSPPPPPSLPRPTEPSMDRLGAMASFRLFAGLTREALHALAEHAELKEFVPGAMVVMKNEPAFALYAIIEGSARVVVRGGGGAARMGGAGAAPDIRLGEGDVFGESCLLGEGERQADVRAETPLMTLRIEKKALDAITAQHAEVGDALFQLLARRLVTNLMHSSPLFSGFAPAARLELAQMFEVRRAEAGTVLAEEGKRSDGLYVLLAGHVTATGEGVDGETRIARGTAFGHASLLGNAPSDVTVVASTEAVLLRLPAAKFSSLAALYPPVLALLAETADEPLRASLLPE